MEGRGGEAFGILPIIMLSFFDTEKRVWYDSGEKNFPEGILGRPYEKGFAKET